MKGAGIKEILYDWWCSKCQLGLYSLDIEASDDAMRPLCPRCGVAVGVAESGTAGVHQSSD